VFFVRGDGPPASSRVPGHRFGLFTSWMLQRVPGIGLALGGGHSRSTSLPHRPPRHPAPWVGPGKNGRRERFLFHSVAGWGTSGGLAR